MKSTEYVSCQTVSIPFDGNKFVLVTWCTCERGIRTRRRDLDKVAKTFDSIAMLFSVDESCVISSDCFLHPERCPVRTISTIVSAYKLQQMAKIKDLLKLHSICPSTFAIHERDVRKPAVTR